MSVHPVTMHTAERASIEKAARSARCSAGSARAQLIALAKHVDREDLRDRHERAMQLLADLDDLVEDLQL